MQYAKTHRVCTFGAQFWELGNDERETLRVDNVPVEGSGFNVGHGIQRTEDVRLGEAREGKT